MPTTTIRRPGSRESSSSILPTPRSLAHPLGLRGGIRRADDPGRPHIGKVIGVAEGQQLVAQGFQHLPRLLSHTHHSGAVLHLDGDDAVPAASPASKARACCRDRARSTRTPPPRRSCREALLRPRAPAADPPTRSHGRPEAFRISAISSWSQIAATTARSQKRPGEPPPLRGLSGAVSSVASSSAGREPSQSLLGKRRPQLRPLHRGDGPGISRPGLERAPPSAPHPRSRPGARPGS